MSRFYVALELGRHGYAFYFGGGTAFWVRPATHPRRYGLMLGHVDVIR